MFNLFGRLFDVKLVFRIALLISFLTALTAFSIWFLSFMSDIYNVIQSVSNSVVNNDVPSTLSCLLKVLGLDVFINSAFSIFWTAMQFWLVAVGYILAYKSGIRAYDGIFKVVQ